MHELSEGVFQRERTATARIHSHAREEIPLRSVYLCVLFAERSLAASQSASHRRILSRRKRAQVRVVLAVAFADTTEGFGSFERISNERFSIQVLRRNPILY
jgi:hypothetical protein